MKPLNTATVHFRALECSDATDLHNGAFGVPEVSDHLQWDIHTEFSETEELMKEMIDLHEQEEKYFWVAISPEDQRIVGLGSIKPEIETAWVGFLVFIEEQRKGYGSAILSALEGVVLKNFNRVTAAVDSRNQPSINLLKKKSWNEWDCDTVRTLKAYEKSIYEG
ncbi:MAG: GNAT family N-acetyltransferase [Akkermansiaceae bacterium]